MNFFKSVFSDDPDPLQPESESKPNNADPDPDPDPGGGSSSGWDFGGLIKTLTSKSETIIETYRRDLQEFHSGLKSEIEVAQGSVGHVIDEFGNTVIKGTAQIISQGKDAILAVDLDSDSDNSRHLTHQGLDSKRYSRFDAQVRAIQGDGSTYTDAPEDLHDFDEWKSGFSLDGKGEEMEGFLRENDAMESVYKRIVPNTLDHETFWYRYYYKVYRIKKAEDVRARLVRRMSREDEDLSWDVEDDEYEGEAKQGLMINKEVRGGENIEKRVVEDTNLQIGASSGTSSNEGGTKRSSVEEVQHSGEEESRVEKRDNLLQIEELGGDRKMEDKSVEESVVEKSEIVQEMGGGGSKETTEEVGVDKTPKSQQVDDAVKKDDDSAAESGEKVIMEKKGDDDGKSSSTNNESSVVESQHPAKEEEEEEDLGWDDIEDLSSIDEKKGTQSQSGGSTSKVDLRKRLSAAEEEEDLSWDIEDDDEPAKA